MDANYNRACRVQLPLHYTHTRQITVHGVPAVKLYWKCSVYKVGLPTCEIEYSGTRILVKYLLFAVKILRTTRRSITAFLFRGLAWWSRMTRVDSSPSLTKLPKHASNNTLPEKGTLLLKYHKEHWCSSNKQNNLKQVAFPLGWTAILSWQLRI